MSLYCINCGADHDYDLAPDCGECIVCGNMLVSDEEDLPNFEDQMAELAELASKNLGVVPDINKQSNQN